MLFLVKLFGNSVLQARTLEILDLEFLLMSIRLQMLEKNALDGYHYH